MKAALVTGGAKRIGAIITRRLAKAGYAVAIHCHRSKEEAVDLAALLQESGTRTTIVTGDLANPEAAAQIIAEAHAGLGPLSLLVNNASVFEDDRLESVDAAGFDRHIAINLRAPVLLSQAFARQVVAQNRPAIINLIDQRVLRPSPLFFSYFLSKAALWTATQTMAQALAPTIRVNAVSPGPTLPNEHDGREIFDREVAATLLGQAVSPEEIANAVLYLAENHHVTGQMLTLDSGQHLGWRTPDVAAILDE